MYRNGADKLEFQPVGSSTLNKFRAAKPYYTFW